ncbi:Protein ABCX-1 [Aphelenchoides avenae]|nr:Protein ABCX-1 [Aphelenchus avenae]
MTPQQFGSRISRVPSHPLPPGLSVTEFLSLHSQLSPPVVTGKNRSTMIDELVEGLALSPCRSRLVENLGHDEQQRLKIAAQMLLDTDVLICENVLRDMDLYDTAFVIDYVRDWAQRLNRIVIVAINPSTPELLEMFGKCRLVYFGESTNMLDYFQSVGYPCPSFKNPCDYYG